jgi:hypothetical protein
MPAISTESRRGHERRYVIDDEWPVPAFAGRIPALQELGSRRELGPTLEKLSDTWDGDCCRSRAH